MKYLLIFLLTFLIKILAVGQDSPAVEQHRLAAEGDSPVVSLPLMKNFPRNNREFKREEENHNCLETKKYSPGVRRKFYPFNIAFRIKLVSFDNFPDSALAHELPMVGGEIDFSKIKESKVLSNGQIDSLTNILFNIEYRGDIAYFWGTGCYNPRNAILFFDSNDHLLEFVEICFECHQHRASSDKIELGHLCDQKFTLIKDFFLKTGIEIGTIKEALD